MIESLKVWKSVLCSSQDTYLQDPHTEPTFQHIFIIISLSSFSQRTFQAVSGSFTLCCYIWCKTWSLFQDAQGTISETLWTSKARSDTHSHTTDNWDANQNTTSLWTGEETKRKPQSSGWTSRLCAQRVAVGIEPLTVQVGDKYADKYKWP